MGTEHPEAQQVHKSSWRYLADINDLGFFTTISQDARDWRTGYSNPMERSYVEGWMPTDLARKFLLNFNFGQNDKFACLCVEQPREVFMNKKVIGIANWDKNPDGEPYIRGPSPGAVSKAQMMGMNANYGEGAISFVQVVDCKWGRSATSKKGLWRAVILALRQSGASS